MLCSRYRRGVNSVEKEVSVRSNRIAITLVLALISIGGCRSAGTGAAKQSSSTMAVPSSVTEPADEAGSAAGDPSGALGKSLREAHEDRSGWESLQLSAECREIDNPRLRSFVAYGNGVGIWEERRQFVLSEDQIAALLGFLRDAGFLDLQDLYGGSGATDGVETDGPPSVDGGVRIICRVDLELGGHHKESAQRLKGEQSAELRALAERLLDVCEPLGESGVGIESLENGLDKIAAGELAPETLHIMLHRKPEPGVRSEGSGFRLNINGTTASVRRFTAGEGYGGETVVTLGGPEVEDLANRLSEIGVEHLPVNLYAEDYTDLRIEILNQRAAIQARSFAGMTPTTHGDLQGQFDQILEILERFANRAIE